MSNRYVIAVSATNADQYGIRDCYTGNVLESGLTAEQCQLRLNSLNKRWTTAKLAADTLADLVNMTNTGADDFFVAMQSEHRTLQQGVMRLIVDYILKVAMLPPDRYDGRNAASIVFAQKLVASEVWKENLYLPHI